MVQEAGDKSTHRVKQRGISAGKWQVTCLSLALRNCGIVNRRTSQATYRTSCNVGWPTLQAHRLYEETVPPHQDFLACQWMLRALRVLRT
jgi:hypothetical protein